MGRHFFTVAYRPPNMNERGKKREKEKEKKEDPLWEIVLERAAGQAANRFGKTNWRSRSDQEKK